VLSGAEVARLAEEEESVRARILEVEQAMERILHHPLGEDGLGRKKVWRMRPPKHLWSEIAGERTAAEAARDSAGAVGGAALGAVRTGAAVVVDTAATVVSWTYKPALWSAAQAAHTTVSTAVSGVATATKLVYSGVHTSANVLVETVDENASSLETLQAELAALSDRLGAVEAKRTRATLKMITPSDGSVWYTDHACSIQWQSSGTISEVRISIASRVTPWVSIATGVPDCGSYTYILPATLGEGWYYLRVEGPRGVPRMDSALFQVKREVPPLMMWSRDHRHAFHRGEDCVLHWAMKEDASSALSHLAPHPHQAETHQGVPAEEAVVLAAAGEEHVKLYLAPRFAPAWRVLADGLPMSGAFHWKVPLSCVQGTYAVQAKGKNLQGGGAVTSPTIYITVKDDLEVVFPKSGAEWRIGSLYPVEWACTGAPRDDVTVQLGSRFFKTATLAEGQQESGSLWWKVPEDVRPGWYFLSVFAASSRLAATSDWIQVLPPDDAGLADALEDFRQVAGLEYEPLAPSAPPLAGPLDGLLAPAPPHVSSQEGCGMSV